MKKALLLPSALAVALAIPMLASAESQLVAGTGTANARLNLRVIVPGFIALKVGTGAILSNTATIDTVEFALTDAQTSVDGTVPATSAGAGAVPVQLMANIGNVNFSSAGAALTSGPDSIPLSRIAVASVGTLNHPTFSAAATAVTPTTGRIINRSSTWTYSYNHQGATAPVGAGTYTTQVTYTAVAP
ncbi:hypothetical protein [Hydrogenophaga sp. BPS33]|uniref:hypothetical protein n=1 Tax=Hydrogenophaga sp. BPS33 TaxID=2651974 RepID=UPI001320245F|nr:hypothetical protein [Hydrogenophaga sp. BPS33]QHE88529.1 hypothetical protein F9K07_28430 [Hydrogenophaga sp. BPS33]